ncbi:hypothetical protein [Marinigracilibium pacificum]|uniref:Uncharacterized protein n=1 Tax=Marinigracilibium pacificum TaxID=2729599 RepID=A0A848ITF2_9BACT|nr:hypothetical protein [Marinigracilibium pacificum]NMM47753.1 hypothetical protein [Marinigracilibium pacificum]
MKQFFISILFLSILVSSCSKDDNSIYAEYEFINEYTATITVGGVVGIEDRTFIIGEIYKGTVLDSETIKIKIAESSEMNKNCPNSWCYQEYVNVPKEYLKLVD